MVYVEFFESKIEALNREKYLKSGHGRNYLKLILKKLIIVGSYPPKADARSSSAKGGLLNKENQFWFSFFH
nr:hypothetical protein [Halpernia humi]